MDENTTWLKPGEKYMLTLSEAAAYFSISERQLRKILHRHQDQGLFFRNGIRLLINRKAFETFLDNLSSL